jgi:hypothetical protein
LKSAGYGQGREQPPLRTGVLIEEQVRDDGAVGYLFSQPIVSQANDELRMDEILGPGFAVVGKTADDVQLSAASKLTLDHLGATILSLEGLNEVRGHFDRVFEFADAVIVRPDRYVFGHTDDQHNLDQLVAILADKLCLT